MAAIITKDSIIGNVVSQKGPEAGEMMDALFCDPGERICCPGVTETLGHAAKLKGKSEEELAQLIGKLNKLPDTKK